MLGRMRGVGHISGKYVRFRDQPPRELAIARVAERQHNLIHLTQLRALGLSADAVRKRAAQGRLHRIVGMLARAATGSFCDALGTLEQLVTYGGREVKLEDVLDTLGVADAEMVLESAEALAQRDPKAALLSVQRLRNR